MSEIDYTDIAETLGQILKDSDTLKSSDNGGQLGNSDLIVEVNEPFVESTAKVPWCGIYLDSWETIPDEERLAANNRFFTRLNFEIWMWEFALESKQGNILSNRVLRKVKEVIKQNRKISNKVEMTTFQGGDFANAKTKKGFFTGVSMKLQMEIFE